MCCGRGRIVAAVLRVIGLPMVVDLLVELAGAN